MLPPAGEGDAGARRDAESPDIHRAELVETPQGQDDKRPFIEHGTRHAPADQTGVAALWHDHRPVFGAETHNGGHLLCRARSCHRHGVAAESPGPVDGVATHQIWIGEGVLRPESGGQLACQLAHVVVRRTIIRGVRR